MAKYTFLCEKCGKSKQLITSVKTKTIQCECGEPMTRQLPNIAGQQVMETVDTFTNTKRADNHDEMIKKRRDDYYWEVEVPRFIQTYSTATCLEQGWLVYNEKGELVINKPPSKR